MSTVLPTTADSPARRAWLPLAALAVGLAALYLPTYVDLARGAWRDDEHAHGPIVLAVVAYLAWRARAALLEAEPASIGWRLAGFALLAAGLAFHFAGRALALTVFEVASHIPVIAGALLVVRGPRALRRLAFPIAFLFFLVPLPGFLIEMATTPLKALVSAAVAAILQVAGYPVLRSGVVLEVGEHQMLVADACSGLNSISSLFALVLVYLHLTGPSSRWRWAALLLAIVPIAIVANAIRVTLLVLVTHHFGEEAARGFLHGFAGMVVFVTALAMVLGIDAVVRRHVSSNDGLDSRLRGNDGLDSRLRGNDAIGPAIIASIAMVSTAAAAALLKPVPMEAAGLDLERMIPAAFGEWRLDPELAPIAPAPDVQARLERIYRQVVNRAYVNGAGDLMMLTVAYGGDQSDALKAHRQEACYSAQGFEIHGLAHGRLALGARDIPVTRMVAVRGERVEPVTYWLTMGDRVVLGRAERLGVQLASGLEGRIPDGMLVRVSSISADAPAAFAAQRSFIVALLAVLEPGDAGRLVGSRR